jgi:hypothetical protein
MTRGAAIRRQFIPRVPFKDQAVDKPGGHYEKF